MSTHTPPPWNYLAGYVSTYINGDYIIIAEVHSTFGTDNFGEETLKLGPKERKANGFLMAAAPEMYELISDLSQAYDDNQSGHELASRLYDLRCRALRLLDKIEGDGE